MEKMLSFTPIELGPSVTYFTLVGMIVPRPIGWITTVPHESDQESAATNLAPYSFFNAISGDPPYVMVSIARRKSGADKDTLRNIKKTSEFVCNIVDGSLTELCNMSSTEYPPDVSEPLELGLELLPSIDVKPPRVARCKAALECQSFQIIPLPESDYTLVLARVVRFHVRSDLFNPQTGAIDITGLDPVARLGGPKYARIGEQITIPPRFSLQFKPSKPVDDLEASSSNLISS